MTKFLRKYLITRARKYIDLSTECITLFLDECEKLPEEKELEELEKISRYYQERSEDVMNIHRFYKEKLREKG